MNGEEEHLLNTEVVEEPPRSRKALAAVVVAATLAAGGVVATSSAGIAPPSTTLQDKAPSTELAWTDTDSSDGWYIYKVAYPGRNGTTEDLLTFMTDFSGGTDCETVNLGCDGYKITCTFVNQQLHYVVAPTLTSEAVDGDGMGVDGWIDVAMETFGDMSAFTAGMHDKLQLWTSSVRNKAFDLEKGGYKTMKRLSTTEAGVDVAHVMVAVGGKIWDFVGEARDLETLKKEGWTAWLDEECPKAHQVDDVNLQTLLALPKDDADTMWIAVTVGQGVSTSDPSLSDFKASLVDMTGAIKTEYKANACEVTSFNYFNYEEQENGGGLEGENVFLKLVYNPSAQVFAKKLPSGEDATVKLYSDYVGRVHEKFLSRPADKDDAHRWRGWDHFLDQHVGIKYTGKSALQDDASALATKEQDLCLVQAGKMNAKFLDEHTLVGKRFIQSDGDHYYTGYTSSSMALEFNTECHYGAAGTTDICTCDPQNSDTLAIDKFGDRSKYSMCDVIYVDQDGHSDTEVPDTGLVWDGKPARK